MGKKAADRCEEKVVGCVPRLSCPRLDFVLRLRSKAVPQRRILYSTIMSMTIELRILLPVGDKWNYSLFAAEKAIGDGGPRSQSHNMSLLHVRTFPPQKRTML
eukprot:scaffold1872_cov262-Amphora_coffeaeformis.AAC.10